MLKNEMKKIVFNRLDEVLKPLGWKAYKSGYNPAYVLDTEQYKIIFDMCFEGGKITFFRIEMAIKEIEPYISECIGDTELLPGGGIIIDNKTVFRTTVVDKTYLEKCHESVIETVDDVNMIVDYFFDHLFGTAKKFVETYLYLPNVVRKMEELDNANISWIHYEKGLLFL